MFLNKKSPFVNQTYLYHLTTFITMGESRINRIGNNAIILRYNHFRIRKD